MASISVIVCAHNEERTIGALLNDVLEQRIPDGWELHEIVVVADGCTDRTADIVRAVCVRDPRVRLLSLPPPNRGKSRAFNEAVAAMHNDAVVLLDADVRLADADIVARLMGALDAGAVLASGNDIPDPAPVRTWGHAASLGRHLIKQELKRDYGVYTCVGRVLAMHRSFYGGLEIPDLPGEDNFRYFTALRRGLSYTYVPDAVVFFKPATSFSDYVRQHARFWHGVAAFRGLFDGDADYGRPRDHLWAVGVSFLRHPVIMASWGTAAAAGQLVYWWQRYIARTPQTGIWELASSTK